MATYASTTTVSTEKSESDIRRLLQKYKATQCVTGWDTGTNEILVAFVYRNRSIRYIVKLPDSDEPRFTRSERGQRSPNVAEKLWKQACRQKWRAVHLIIKAKLEGVESGIVTLEDEFLANTMLPSGQTVGEFIKEPLERALEAGGMPLLMPRAMLALPPGPKEWKKSDEMVWVESS